MFFPPQNHCRQLFSHFWMPFLPRKPWRTCGRLSQEGLIDWWYPTRRRRLSRRRFNFVDFRPSTLRFILNFPRAGMPRQLSAVTFRHWLRPMSVSASLVIFTDWLGRKFGYLTLQSLLGSVFLGRITSECISNFLETLKIQRQWCHTPQNRQDSNLDYSMKGQMSKLLFTSFLIQKPVWA